MTDREILAVIVAFTWDYVSWSVVLGISLLTWRTTIVYGVFFLVYAVTFVGGIFLSFLVSDMDWWKRVIYGIVHALIFGTVLLLVVAVLTVVDVK